MLCKMGLPQKRLCMAIASAFCALVQTIAHAAARAIACQAVILQLALEGLGGSHASVNTFGHVFNFLPACSHAPLVYVYLATCAYGAYKNFCYMQAVRSHQKKQIGWAYAQIAFPAALVGIIVERSAQVLQMLTRTM